MQAAPLLWSVFPQGHRRWETNVAHSFDEKYGISVRYVGVEGGNGAANAESPKRDLVGVRFGNGWWSRALYG
jgi:hypothetical protein